MTQVKQTERAAPTPGAMRAGSKLTGVWPFEDHKEEWDKDVTRIAQIIDDETGVRELLIAAKVGLDQLNDYLHQTHENDVEEEIGQAFLKLEAAITKAQA